MKRRGKASIPVKARGRQRSRASNTDSGDTLIELLIAMVIIGLTVSALLGALVTSLAGAADHRSFATLDSLVKSFAETAKYQIQLQPNTSTSAPLFTNCSPGYQLVGAPNPASGGVGTAVTIFGTGFTDDAPITAKIGTTTVAAAVTRDTSAPTMGNVAATFTVPALPAGSYSVSLLDGSTSVTSESTFSVTSSPPVTTSPLLGFTLNLSSIEYWNASTNSFSTSCSPTDTQLINLSASSPGGITDALSFVVVNPAYVSSVTPGNVTVAPPTNPQPFQSMTFTATVTGTTNNGPPTGTVAWTISYNGSTVGAPTCSTSTVNQAASPAVTSSATCMIPNATPGAYSITATYSGDPNYAGGTGSASATVGDATPTVGVTYNSTAAGANLTLTATVYGATGGSAPTGTVNWTISSTSCQGSNPSTLVAVSPATSPPTSTTTCTIANAAAGTYSVTAAYSGGGPYSPNSGGTNATVGPNTAIFNVAITPSTPTPGQTLTATATLTAPGSSTLTPTGTITWAATRNGVPISCSPSTTTLAGGGGTSTATCAISSAIAGTYVATATYGGDPNYDPGGNVSQSSSPVADLYLPAVGVTFSPSNPTLGSSFTIIAKVTGSGSITPTGTVNWTISNGASVICSSTTALMGSAGSAQATCTITTTHGATNVTYTVSAAYSGDPSYTSQTGNGSVTVVPPPFNVTGITSANGAGNSGGTGLAQSGDSISITFSEPLNLSTISALGSTGTISIATQGSTTNISIAGSGSTGLTTNSPIKGKYWSTNDTGKATGTIAISADHMTATFTLNQNPSGATGSAQAVSAANTFTLTPTTSLIDTDGISASGSFAQSILLF